MIVASNAKGGTDPNSRPRGNLKRILRFESYRSVAEGSAAVAPGGDATITLTRGHRIELKADAQASARRGSTATARSRARLAAGNPRFWADRRGATKARCAPVILCRNELRIGRARMNKPPVGFVSRGETETTLGG